MRDRWLPLTGAANARDLGGLPLIDGGTTAYDVLWRTDTPAWWTEDDRSWLREHGLAVVVDLRAPKEADADGIAAVDGVTVVNTPLLRDAVLNREDRRREKRDIAIEEPTPETRRLGYVDWLDGEAGGNIGLAVRALADAPGAALFHCSAGKDRTGVVAALVLTLSGVEREAVVEDFVASTERVKEIYATLLRSPTHGPLLDGVDPKWLMCHREAVEGLLDRVDEAHGGIAAYLASVGVTAEDQDRLRSRVRGG
jgi:protein-tyrosine phosphatase